MHCTFRNKCDRKALFNPTDKRVNILSVRFNLSAGNLEVIIAVASRQKCLPVLYDKEPRLYEMFQICYRQANSKEMSFAPSHNTALPKVLRFSSPEVSVMKWFPASIPIFDAKQTPP